MFYVTCDVDVGRAKGNLWHRTTKDDSMCEENDIEMEQAATIYRQVDPRSLGV